MESPLSLFRMHWDHELPGGCSAGVLACECTGRPARCSCGRRDAAATRSRDGCATRFMESPLGLTTVHGDHEPLVPRRTKSADKSDALQTLRACGRVSGPRDSVWSACVFSAAFPRQAAIRWPG